MHNYFPDFLYNNSRFTNIREVFNYINTMIQNQFDVFGHGRSLYRENTRVSQYRTSESDAVQANTQTAARSSTRASRDTSTAAAPAPAATPAAAPRNQRQPRILSASYSVYPQLNQIIDEISFGGLLPTPFISQNVGLNDVSNSQIGQQTEEILGQLLDRTLTPSNATDSLSIFFQTLLNPRSIPTGSSQFMEPVQVRPTAQQIADATSLIRLEHNNNEVTCAICQDEINNTQIVRRINHCSHCFHQNCVDQHFQNSVRCPMCRHDIRENTSPRPTNASNSE
jgi:ribosomal protein S27E